MTKIVQLFMAHGSCLIYPFIIVKKPLNGQEVYPNGVKPYEIETRFGYDQKNKYGEVKKPMCGCFWLIIWLNLHNKIAFKRKWYLSDILRLHFYQNSR